MKNLKKIKFSDITGMLEPDEAKEILGGGPIRHIHDQEAPGEADNIGGNSGFGLTGFGQGGFVSGSANNFAQLGSYGNSSYNNGSYGSGTNNGGSSNGGTSPISSIFNNNNNTSAWSSNAFGISTTSQSEISRFLNFVSANNATNNNINTFLNNELTASGRALNDATYGAIMLNEVTVINKYKGSSNYISDGLTYNEGILEMTNSYYNGGSTFNGVDSSSNNVPGIRAILTPFTKEQVVNGFSKINFSNMGLKSISDFDPIKKAYLGTFEPVMKLNAEGAISIALYEQLSLSVYDKDSNSGQNTTIGFGHLIHKGAINSSDPKSITFDQAISYLASDIVATQNVLNQKIENLDLTGKFNRNQYFALVDMAYNGGNSDESILTKVLNAMKSGGVEAANNTIKDAYLNAGPNSGGLMDRRYFEAQAFIYGKTLTPAQSLEELINLGLKK